MIIEEYHPVTSLVKEIQTNAGNGTKHGEKSIFFRKIESTITECQLNVARTQKLTIELNL